MTEEKFEELKTKLTKDLDVNKSNILLKSIETPKMYSYYLNFYSKELKYYKDLLLLKETTYGELFDYYKFDYEKKLDKKSEIEPFIKSNKKYNKVLIKCNNQEMYVTWLEHTLKNINQISFNIKNYIEYQKFINGEH